MLYIYIPNNIFGLFSCNNVIITDNKIIVKNQSMKKIEII